MSLHRLWIAEHVHDDGSDAVPGDDVHHGGLPQSGDIVHDGSPGLDCLRGHLGLHRVDGKRYVDFGDQVTDYRTDPAPLFIRSHRIRSGSSRLTAHVEDIGPVFHHLETMTEGLIRIEVAPTVGERIGGDVEDPHYARSVEPNLAGPMAPDRRGRGHRRKRGPGPDEADRPLSVRPPELIPGRAGRRPGTDRLRGKGTGRPRL